MTGLSGLTSGDVLLGDVRRPGWWLVERADVGLDRVVAGPFGDRTEAAWAAAVQVTAALTDAGLPLHDARGAAPAGGVCLAPEPVLGGVVVTWRQHDRTSLERSAGSESDTLVQQVMGAAVAEVLSLRSFTVEQLSGSTGVVVRWGA
jgi:hypothetical protein